MLIDKELNHKNIIYSRQKASAISDSIFTTFICIKKENMLNLIWTAVVVLFILWLLGVSIHIGGSLIHLLLILALIGIVYNLFIGRRIV